MSFKDHVYNIVSKIPKGSVLSYAEVARRAGSPRAARAVGNVLNKNPRPFKSLSTSLASDVPCHRVICSDGSVGGYAGGTNKKSKLLRKEGVLIKDGKVILEPVLKGILG